MIQAYKNYMVTIATLLNVTATATERFVRSTIALERRLVKVSIPLWHARDGTGSVTITQDPTRPGTPVTRDTV